MRENLRQNRFEPLDMVLLILLILGVLLVLVPFLYVLSVSFTSYKEYMQSTWIVWPRSPTLDAYREIVQDGRILVGFKTTATYVLVGLPMNLVLDTMMAYAFSRKDWPGRRLILLLILFTMIFNGGIVPLYLVIKSLGLSNSIWAVILLQGMNTFNMILIYNYFCSLPEALMESARLDGANEWTVLFRIMIPLSKPILATVVLFTAVQLWNEYFFSMVFLRSNYWMSIQQVLRSIIIDSQLASLTGQSASMAMSKQQSFTEGLKTASVVVTILPVLAIYPFLQRYFTKGIMIGAIKA